MTLFERNKMTPGEQCRVNLEGHPYVKFKYRMAPGGSVLTEQSDLPIFSFNPSDENTQFAVYRDNTKEREIISMPLSKLSII